MNEFLKEFLRAEFEDYEKNVRTITEDEFETMLENIAITAEEIIKERN